MAVGSLSFIGLGSGGALSYDIIDKLREVDEKAVLNPLERQISESRNKELVFQDIMSKLNELKSSLFDIAGPTLYTTRKVTVEGADLTATVSDGATVQQADIKVKQLALADIKQTKGFDSEDAEVTDTDTDMTITINGQDTTFTVTAGTTLKELKTQIEEAMDGKVNVTLLNTGTDSNPYRLILKSAQTGADQAMSFSFSDDNDFLDLTADSAKLQDAQDALITVDGAEVYRPTNTIDDVLQGVTLNLKSANDTDNLVTVSQDNEKIADKIEAFVNLYNTLMSKFDNTTKYDPDTKETGVFQGDSTISALQQRISTIVLDRTADGGALNALGIDVDRYGKMSFDRAAFLDALQKDPESVEKTFAGDSDNPGILAQLKNYLDTTTAYGGMLSQYDDYLKNNITELEKQKEKAVERLDNKYDIMAKQFMAYDAMIAKMNASFSSLAAIIDAQAAAAKK